MNTKLFLLFLVACAAIGQVKCESTIEVDENGDQYEVKRFNIQGRQLNEGRSQCVVSRRKRALQPKLMYSDAGLSDEVDGKNNTDFNKSEEQQPMLLPPVAIDTFDEEDLAEKEDEEDGLNISAMEKDKEKMKESNKNVSEEITEDEWDKDDDSIEVIQIPQLTVFGQRQGNGDSAAATDSAPGVAQAITDGITVVQSPVPNNVNQQTHVVFELVPVYFADTHEYDDDGSENDFDFKEELNPVTTTAIWSTGDDSFNDNYDDYDLKPIKTQKIVKRIKKPLKSNKQKKKISMKPKRKNKYKRPNWSQGHKKRRNNKKRANKNTSLHRPIKKRKLHRGNTTRRRSPPKNKHTAIKTQKNKQKNNKYSQHTVSNNKIRNLNARKRLIAEKNKDKNNEELLNQGANTFTRTMTMTQTGNEDDDKTVNCIIIYKDPPPTTARPFWNILGRNANGVPQASGHFGMRKRANARFVA